MRFQLKAGALLAALLAAVAIWCTLADAVTSSDDELVVVDSAQAHLAPDGLPARDATVDLRVRWDVQFPGRGGRATYRIELPARKGAEPMALFFSRVGNQAELKINGNTATRWGTLGNPRYDAAKNCLIVTLPASMLFDDRPNELVVDVTIQAQRWGGLSELRYGPQSAVEELYDEQRRWRHSSAVVFAASLAGVGGLALLLWLRQRDALYGWFSLAAFLGVVRNVDRIWPDVPVPWPLWGVIAAVCYVSHLALICRFTLMALGPISRRIDIAIDGVIVVASSLAILAYAAHLPVLWTIALFTLVPLGLVSLAVVVLEAWRLRTPNAFVLCAAGGLAIAAGIYDLVVIRAAHSSGLNNPLTQHAMFVFVLIMAGLMAERYNRSVADFRTLNADLSRRVADREQQLRGMFDSLREQQRQQAVSTERQRIMREIHDGVGSQLVGLLNMVTHPNASPAALQEQVQLALDEMRMAVDSLQPVHDDLITVLATLRYRLQPRLQAAGIEVVWDMAELPTLRQLSPQGVLQVQRILLEAFTNVLKHAKATQVVVQSRWHEPSRVALQIADNGVGLGDPAGDHEPRRHGRGIGNMLARAAAIGAELRIEPGEAGGVCVTLDWKVERERASDREVQGDARGDSNDADRVAGRDASRDAGRDASRGASRDANAVRADTSVRVSKLASSKRETPG